MKKTEHYQLNQWDGADRVLRTDFNEDNAKIDGALHALAGRGMATRLKTFTTTGTVTGTAVYTMDLQGIDWAAWQYVFMDFALLGSGYMLLYPNGNPKGAYSSGYVTSSSYDSLVGMLGCGPDGAKIMRAELQVFHCAGQGLRAVCPYERITGKSDVTYADLKTLHLTPDHESYTMTAGSTITLWGVK